MRALLPWAPKPHPPRCPCRSDRPSAPPSPQKPWTPRSQTLTLPPLLLLQIRQALTEVAILPLGSQFIHERAPYIKSLLLYGAEKTGKTLLTHAVANLSGANLFDLSPRNTDGKYPGKNVNMMIHMVFKVR